MKEGDIVKAFIQQADGEIKPRPAVLIKKLPYFDDWLICGISRKTYAVHKGFDIVITNNSKEFSQTGLDFDMVVRAGWLHNFRESKIEGSLGSLTSERLKELKANITRFINS